MTTPIGELRAKLDRVGGIAKAVSEASAVVRGDVAAQQQQRTNEGGGGDGGGSGGGQERT